MRYFIAVSFTVLLCLPALVGYDQDTTIDSLKQVLQSQKEDTNRVKTLNRLSSNYFFISGNTDSAKIISSAAIALSQKINYPKGEIDAYVNIGYGYLMDADYLQSITSLNKALHMSDSLRYDIGRYDANYALGRVYERSGNYPAALKYQYESLKLAKERNDINSIFDALGAVGFIYIDQNNLPEAEKNFQEGLKLAIQAGDSLAIALASKNLADVYLKQGNANKSLRNLLTAVRIFELYERVPHIAWTWYSIGLCYLKIAESEEPIRAKTDLKQSHSYFEKSKQLYEKLKDKISIAECYADIGNVLTKLNKPGDARKSLQTSLVLSMEAKSQENLKKTYLLLAGLDSIEGDYKQAYQHYKLYSLYKDSLSDEEASKKAMQEKFQYEFDEKTSKAQLEQNKKDAETTRKRTQQYFTIAGLAVVVLAIALIAFIQFRNSKHKQRANILLQQQKEEIAQQRDKVENTLSDLKSTQSQLIQSEKMASLGQLTAGIAHEIQNPLNFVNNFSDINTELIDELKQEATTGNLDNVITIAGDIKENEQKINHHGKRADAIVKGMLQHSRTSTGTKEPTDINALVDEYLRLAYHGMRAKDKNFNAAIKTGFDNRLGKINVIPQDIGRVLINLYNNAFYAVGEKAASCELRGVSYEPLVSVQTKKLNEKIEIRVADNGNGIPQNIVDKIFQPFFTTKPTGQGTGLGLSLAYDIVKTHGGELKLEAKEGEGSEFTIKLPLNEK